MHLESFEIQPKIVSDNRFMNTFGKTDKILQYFIQNR